MCSSINQKIRLLNEKIFNCKQCDFHNELAAKGIKYRPELIFLRSNNYQVISIGLNPGWKDSESHEWEKRLYSKDNFSDYSSEIKKMTEEKGEYSWPYARGLTEVFNYINDNLNIYSTHNIKAVDIYKYVLWSNLAFCNSNKVDIRNPFFGQDISCRTFSEEIPNCLDEGYLNNIIKIIKPQMILFFGVSITDYMYYKRLIGKLLKLKSYNSIHTFENSNNGKKAFEAHTRNNKKVNVNIYAGKIDGYQFEGGNLMDIKFLFFPHPNFQFTYENKRKALDTICKWF